MNIKSLEKRVMLMTNINMVVRTVLWILLGWLSVETILYIGEHGLKNLLEIIWFGKGK